MRRYYLPLTTAVLGVSYVVIAATAVGSVGRESGIKTGPEKIQFAKQSNLALKNRIASNLLAPLNRDKCVHEIVSAKKTETISNVTGDVAHEQRVMFAAGHGVADPDALVAAVRYSPMANLLISVAIEESLGDPVAVGSAGEQGAWQVIASHWGSVPNDICGQAGQAERIITGLMIHAKGNKKKALAHYNGGTTPPRKSYRYAERILKRARHLQVAANHLPRNYIKLRQALLNPGDSRLL